LKSIFWFLLLLHIITCPSFASSKHSANVTKKSALTMRHIAEKCLPSVVMITIRGYDGQVIASGSGFVIEKNLIATNVHVVQDAHEVTVNFTNGRSVEAPGVVNGDNTSDLAILYADTGTTLPISLAPIPAHIGDTVIALGSPEGLSGSMSTGIISGIRIVSGIKVLQTTAPISHGSSGGPLLNEFGEVLGVTSFMLKDGQNLNFAYPSYYLKLLIPSRIVSYMSWNKKDWILVETTLGAGIEYDAIQYSPRGKYGKHPNRFDAASFVKAIFAKNGIKLPTAAYGQAATGYDVPRGDLLSWAPGDRLYFAFNHPFIDHTGIYLEQGDFIHVSASLQHNIVVDRVTDDYFANHLVCVRRSRELVGEPVQAKRP
jgi:hypothetical protein